MTQIPHLELKMKSYFNSEKFSTYKRPFLAIANELHTTEEKVLEILNEAKDENIIRQTSAILIQKN